MTNSPKVKRRALALRVAAAFPWREPLWALLTLGIIFFLSIAHDRNPLITNNALTSRQPARNQYNDTKQATMSSHRSEFQCSQELKDLLRTIGLLNINSSSIDEPSPSQHADTDDPANQPTLPLEDNFYTAAIQETTTATSSSVRSSLEYSFSSLQVTDEDWLAIDELTAASTTSAPVLKDTQPAASKPLSTSTTTPEIAKFKFSPSVLAHHANTACEKMLHLKGRQLWDQALQHKATPELAAQEQEQRTRPPVTVADATTRRGVVFESQLQSRIKDRVDCEAEQDKDSYFRLATTPDNTTLCQPIFSLDKSFYTPEMEKAGIVFGRFIPDFIKVLPGSVAPDGTRKKRIFIIDAKSSSHVKISHQVTNQALGTLFTFSDINPLFSH